MTQANELRVIVSFKFNKPVTQDMYARLAAFIKAARNSSGCIHMDLMEDIHHPEFFSLVALWSSWEAHDVHTRSVYFRDFAAFLSANVTDLNVRTLKYLTV